MTARTRQTAVWLQIVPVYSRYWNPPEISGIRVAKVTQRKPGKPVPGAVLIKIYLAIPETAFRREWETTLALDESQIEAVPVVTAAQLGGSDA